MNIEIAAALPSTIRLHGDDDVVIARFQLLSGAVVQAERLTVSGLIPPGHKVAVRDLAPGQPVRRYGQIIGFATQAIRRGQHVHVHNLGMGHFAREGAAAGTAPAGARQGAPASFQGILRADGRVATRNYVGVLTSVNCSATVARAIADRFRRDIHPLALQGFPNVDGVVALTHGGGCAIDGDGEGLRVLRRTLAGYARQVNFAAVLVVGLGCETNQIPAWMAAEGLQTGAALRAFTIQESGGTALAVERGVAAVQELLPDADRVCRQCLPASHLCVGLQCGGSDGYSGISANPALGVAMDLLVQQGGTAILSETPELYGAEHLLTRRAATPEVAAQLMARIRWWQDYCTRMGADLNNNPSAGNKAGGLTTILEKSLGALAKGGSSRLEAVVEYAQAVHARGLVFMDTPGYDPVSATGQVAGGANLICFTTGRGSAYGCAPVPCMKLSTHTGLWQRQQADVDLNCGSIIDGEKSVDEVGHEIFEMILAVASGQPTKSEGHGYGQSEFVPWQLGAVT